MSQSYEYTTILHSKMEKFTKKRDESFPQFSVRIETYIKALEKGYTSDKALMLSSIVCNNMKYGVVYRNKLFINDDSLVGPFVSDDDKEPK